MEKAFFQTLLILGGIALAAVLAFVLLIWKPYEDKEDEQVVDFKNQFGIQLPEGATTLHSQSNIGWMGDGYALLTVDIPEDEMPAMQEAVAGSWSELPTPTKYASQLYEMAKPFMNKDAIAWFWCFQQRGYYHVQNRKGLPLSGNIERDTAYNDIAYNDIAWAVLDTEENRLYYLSWRM